MLHDDVDTIIAQAMFLDTQLLKANVVLEHFPEVDRYALTDCPVDWIINVKFFQRIVARIKHRENTDDSIMFNLVVSEVEGEHFIVGEEQFCYHHRTIRLNFVSI